MSSNGITSKTIYGNSLEALKHFYSGSLENWFSHYSDGVKGAKEELIARINKLSTLEKIMIGLEDNNGEGNTNGNR